MALFKISKGLKKNLPGTKTAGYCWYTTDDSLFYVDYEDENGQVQRKALNAKDAETLTGASLSTILNSSDVEIPTSQAVLNAINNSTDFLIDIADDKTCDKTSAEINEAYANGRLLKARYQGIVFHFIDYDSRTSEYLFTNIFNSNTNGNVIIGGKVFVTTSSDTPVIEYGLINEFFTPQSSTNLTTTKKNVIQAINEVNEKATNAIEQSNIQSDWSVNDETSPSYIQNRTHWVSDEYQKTLFESQDVEFLYNTEYGVSIANITFADSPKEGTELTVVFGDTEYPVVVQRLGMSLVIGNLSIAEEGSDTGEPFVSINRTDADWEVYTQDTANTTRRMSAFYVTQDYHKLDKIYLPDDVILPEVSSEEEGYTLAVQDGRWDVQRPIGMSAGIGTGGEIFNSYFGDFINEAGVYGHAEGETTKALGQASHTSGQGTIASGLGQYVFGTYNIVDNSASEVDWAPERGKRKYVHIVGNGINNSRRSNAHTLDWSGNAWFKGDVKVGGTGQDDANASKLATENYVDAIIASMKPKSTTVTILAANWTGNANPWSQVVSINGITENSKIDLQPTAQQIVALQDAEVSIMLQNDSGIVTAWAIGKKPTVNYTFDVLITEVSVI